MSLISKKTWNSYKCIWNVYFDGKFKQFIFTYLFDFKVLQHTTYSTVEIILHENIISKPISEFDLLYWHSIWASGLKLNPFQAILDLWALGGPHKK